ncbi:NF038130 family PEP-CTERM protein [Leptolyngbya sp. FACHB-711]|uniref:NF038130 family PEP-CTERM protein n=1 Tax=unclassified Leptolyngbya TaxID=2650499 RepID=UPI001684FA07|nr:NF038130 family PEP-CTERM protein [Leptolyngbya sp. FACHB-711]MBD1851537.1 NF038130 family PEP-CTERM protein [Cyanobacteria bacterium FACHB-502]MBD2025851.1 NF038130 family PEP-CTERM protein [Leptolyngbya sp. FACHB-711]
MAIAIKQILLGAAVCLSAGAIVSPSNAATLTPRNIIFDTSNYRTYTGGSNGIFSSNHAGAAIAALQDSNPTSNVELWASTENPTANVGFSSTLGKYNVTVQSVTAADWAVFGNQWLTDFLASSAQITQMWSMLTLSQQRDARSSLLSLGLPSSGDPNVGSLTLDSLTGQLKLDLIGHLDLRPRILARQYSTGNTTWDNILLRFAGRTQSAIQASEIAKVTIGKDTYYAYSFNATSTGVSTNDGSESYTGRYTWTKTLAPSPKSTPEPSVIGSLIVAGGLVASRKLKTAA